MKVGVLKWHSGGPRNSAWYVVAIELNPHALITLKSCLNQSFSNKWGSWLNQSSVRGYQESQVRKVTTSVWIQTWETQESSIMFWMCGCQNPLSRCRPDVTAHLYSSLSVNRTADRQPIRTNLSKKMLLARERQKEAWKWVGTIRVEALIRLQSKLVS